VTRVRHWSQVTLARHWSQVTLARSCRFPQYRHGREVTCGRDIEEAGSYCRRHRDPRAFWDVCRDPLGHYVRGAARVAALRVAAVKRGLKFLEGAPKSRG
jgi:hypothetical protein